jgi:hypothetical protein
MKVIERVNKAGKLTGHGVMCPACKRVHYFDTGWKFDGNHERPTFDPSMLVQGYLGGGKTGTCHSFLKNGQWQFLSDSTHELAGKTVDVIDLPESLADLGQVIDQRDGA